MKKQSSKLPIFVALGVVLIGLLLLLFFLSRGLLLVGVALFIFCCIAAGIAGSYTRWQGNRMDEFKADLDKLSPEELEELRKYGNRREYILEWKKNHPNK